MLEVGPRTVKAIESRERRAIGRPPEPILINTYHCFCAQSNVKKERVTVAENTGPKNVRQTDGWLENAIVRYNQTA